MADETEHPGLDDNIIKLADHLKDKQGKPRQPRKPKNKREMPETDEYSQSGCEMRPNVDKPGLYLISGLGVWLAQLFWIIGTCDAYELDGVARRRGILIGFKNDNGRDVKLFLSNDILFGDRTKLAKALSAARFSFVSADKQLGILRCYLSDYACSRRAIVVGRAGWVERDGELIGFMLPSGMIPDRSSREHRQVCKPGDD
jgi:hypothetical protein